MEMGSVNLRPLLAPGDRKEKGAPTSLKWNGGWRALRQREASFSLDALGCVCSEVTSVLRRATQQG